MFSRKPVQNKFVKTTGGPSNAHVTNKKKYGYQKPSSPTKKKVGGRVGGR